MCKGLGNCRTNHQSIIVRGLHGDGNQRLVDGVEKLADRFAFFSLAIGIDELFRHFDWVSKLNDGPRAEFVSMEIIQAAWYNFQAAMRVRRQSTKRHHSNASYNMSENM